jgi:hypothetical protein
MESEEYSRPRLGDDNRLDTGPRVGEGESSDGPAMVGASDDEREFPQWEQKRLASDTWLEQVGQFILTIDE